LKINGEAIYESSPWKYQNDTSNPDVWYTSNNNTVYAILVKTPGHSVKLGAMGKFKFDQVQLLGYDGDLNWITTDNWVVIYTNMRINENVKWSWVFKFTNVV
jgi:alpha-L-fucosidase